MVAPLALSDRLRSARRILFGRGDDAVVCSFCGEDRCSRDIVAGPGVAICGPCAHITLEYVAAQSADPVPNGTNEVGVMVVADGACLLPQARATLAGDLARAARSLSCEVLSWSYAAGTRHEGDYLSVRLARPDHIAGDDLTERFTEAFLLPNCG